MKTNTFFTIFWMLYFPLCIAFYMFLRWDWSDEILTACLILYAIHKGTFRLKSNEGKMREVWTYVGIMAFYIVYSLIMALNVSAAVWMDLQQQIRPYAVFYATWVLAPQFTEKQKMRILKMMLTTTFIYFVAWRSGVRGMAFHTTESVAVGQLTLVTGMAWYLWKPMTKRNALIAIAICAVGVFGDKSKFFGELVAFVAIVYFLKGRIKLNSIKTVLQLAVLTTAVLFFTWSKFNIYYVEGFQDDERRARPETYKVASTIIFQDYVPFGTGMGTFATHAAAVYYPSLYYKYDLNTVWGLTPKNPMFLMDAFYPTLAEFGLFGVIMFIIFWRRRLKAAIRLPDIRCYKIALMCILALALESTADSSYLSGKGMGYFMLLAICLNSARIVRPSAAIRQDES